MFKLNPLKSISASYIWLCWLTACGSHQSEDLQVAETAQKESPAPLNPVKTDSPQSEAQVLKSKGLLTSNCRDDLKLVTQIAKDSAPEASSARPRTVLTGQIEPNCSKGKTAIVSFSSPHSITFVPLMSCEVTAGRPPLIICKSPAAQLLADGVVTIPVLLEAGTNYSDFRASIEFE